MAAVTPRPGEKLLCTCVGAALVAPAHVVHIIAVTSSVAPVGEGMGAEGGGRERGRVVSYHKKP